MDEGVIKFNIDWEKSQPLNIAGIQVLIDQRNELFRKGWIGFDPEYKVSFGNVSLRFQDGFVISGTQTGNIPIAGPEHFTLVTKFDLEKNFISCKGPCKASSESLTHAAIYNLNPQIYSVVHIHNLKYWERMRGVLPTSHKKIDYGTIEMAAEIARLEKEENLFSKKILVMAGHEGGIISFGNDPVEAKENLVAATRFFPG